MRLILTQAEVDELVDDAVHMAVRLRRLDALGIPYKIEGKRIVISRAVFESIMSGRPHIVAAANEPAEMPVNVEGIRRGVNGQKAAPGR